MKNSITKFTKHTGKNIAKFAKKNPTAATITVGGIGISCCGLITSVIRTNNSKKKLKKLCEELEEENKKLSDGYKSLSDEYHALKENTKTHEEEQA